MKLKFIKHMALVTDVPEEILRKLQVANVYDGRIIPAYLKDSKGRGYWIPRALVKKPPLDAGWEKITIVTNYRLKSYQSLLVDEFIDRGGSGILQSGTGTGKTIMGIEIIKRLGLKALVIVPTDQIMTQWVNTISYHCGFLPSIIRGQTITYNKPITVAMIQTIVKGKAIEKYRNELYAKFGTVVYDEVHRLGAEKFHKAATMFWDKYRVGLTATVNRRDGMTPLFQWHIGDVIASYTKMKMIPSIQVVRYLDPNTPQIFHPHEKSMIARYFNFFAKNSPRNKLIAALALAAYRQQRRILILTDRLHQVKWLYSFLSEFAPTGRFTRTDKEFADIIVGTYGSAGTGFDYPLLDCIIFATPRADIRQAIGRILRPKDKVPLVIDIVDDYVRIFKNYYQARLKYYKVLGCKVNEIIISKENVNGLLEREMAEIQKINSPKKKNEVS